MGLIAMPAVFLLPLSLLLAAWGLYRPEPPPSRLAALSLLVFAFFASLIPIDLFYLLPALPILWLAAPLMAMPWNWRRWTHAQGRLQRRIG